MMSIILIKFLLNVVLKHPGITKIVQYAYMYIKIEN